MTDARYPKPDLPYAGYSDLQFATPWQVHSHLVLAGYDRGELTMEPRHVCFRGMTSVVDCPNVTAIRLVRKAFPIGVVVVVAALALAAASVSDVSRRPQAYALVTGLLVVLSIIQLKEQWIEIAYSSTPGQNHLAYFRRRSIPGLMNTKTRTLYRQMLDAVTPGV